MSMTAHQLSEAEVANQSVLDDALKRMKKAIDGLEAVLNRRERDKESATALEEELQVLFEDRSRLAHELDRVKSRASKLDAVSAEVAGRLDKVMTDIGSVLGHR